MRIALLATPYPLEEAPSPPLGICYVAAACETAGAEVRIFDYIVRQYTPQKLIDEIEQFKPDVVGASSVTMNFPVAHSMIRTVKRNFPDIITMMGGPHVSFDYHNILTRSSEVDLIVIGEAEQTLRELLPVIKDRGRWQYVKGIAFRNNGQIVTTPPRDLIQDLDSLPIPARQHLPMSRYLALGFPVSIITSRGCPNQCIFCLGRRMVGKKVRHRSIESVLDEIEQILTYGFTRINIADDLFTAVKSRAIELCEAIIRQGSPFSWSAFARVNTVDTELLKVMREAGCDTVSFGIESGNTEMLKIVKKGITLQQARKAIESCKEAGMRAHASFIVGLPGETLQTMEDSDKFAQELGIEYGYHFLAPFPGTTVREEVEKYDLEILTDDWALYDANRPIVQTSQASPENMEQFVSKLENEQKIKWKETEDRYQKGTCSPEELFQVEAFHRLDFVYQILSKDMIEKHASSITNDGDHIENLSDMLAGITGINTDLVFRTIQGYVNNNYLKNEIRNGTVRWYWTHNNRIDVLPVSNV